MERRMRRSPKPSPPCLTHPIRTRALGAKRDLDGDGRDPGEDGGTAGFAVRRRKLHPRPAGRQLPGGRSRPNGRGFFANSRSLERSKNFDFSNFKWVGKGDPGNSYCRGCGSLDCRG